jgi:hypothetical protein
MSGGIETATDHVTQVGRLLLGRCIMDVGDARCPDGEVGSGSVVSYSVAKHSAELWKRRRCLPLGRSNINRLEEEIGKGRLKALEMDQPWTGEAI